MPFAKPDLTELVERARQAFRSELPGTDAWLWPNNINVSAKVMALMTHTELVWLDYVAKQRWVTTADGEFLDRHGEIYAVPRLSPTYARGYVTMTGTPGVTIPAGIEMTRGDGINYETSAPATVSATGTANIAVVAKEPGVAGNSPPGATVSLVSLLDSLNADGVVASTGIGLGADEETDESYRARLLWRLRMPPHGGAAHDYVAWAREINGVTRVFVDPLAEGPGTVTIYFLMDELYDDGIPQAADVSAVDAYIQTVRPVTAVVTVAAPVKVPVNVRLSPLSPDTTAVRDAIRLELEDMFKRETKVSTASEPFTLYRSKIWQAISNATGEDYHVLLEPSDDVTYATGEFPVLEGLFFYAVGHSATPINITAGSPVLGTPTLAEI